MSCNNCINAKICPSESACDHYDEVYSRSEVVSILKTHKNPMLFLKKIEAIYNIKLSLV